MSKFKVKDIVEIKKYTDENFKYLCGISEETIISHSLECYMIREVSEEDNKIYYKLYNIFGFKCSDIEVEDLFWNENLLDCYLKNHRPIKQENVKIPSRRYGLF